MLHSAVCHMLRSTVLFHVQYGMFATVYFFSYSNSIYWFYVYVIYQVLLYRT